jgi:hypothetical protein
MKNGVFKWKFCEKLKVKMVKICFFIYLYLYLPKNKFYELPQLETYLKFQEFY